MKSPIMTECVAMGYANLSFEIRDKEDYFNKFYTSTVRWRWRGRYPEKLEDYYKREELLKTKIQNWLKEALSNAL